VSGVTRLTAHPPTSSFVPEDSQEAGTLISGTPDHRDAEQFASSDGRATCGAWTCGAYEEHVRSFPINEMFVVIEGTLTVTVDGGDPETFDPGDVFVIEQGTACTMRFHTPFRKLYMAYEAPN